jgi:hypothetical protein
LIWTILISKKRLKFSVCIPLIDAISENLRVKKILIQAENSGEIGGRMPGLADKACLKDGWQAAWLVGGVRRSVKGGHPVVFFGSLYNYCINDRKSEVCDLSDLVDVLWRRHNFVPSAADRNMPVGPDSSAPTWVVLMIY